MGHAYIAVKCGDVLLFLVHFLKIAKQIELKKH